jgi:molybdenum cofactor cytidylyltransferase
MTNIAAILLAAGSASRMGRTKQLLRIGGQSLVRRAAQAALDAGCHPVIVVTGADSKAVAAEITGLSVNTQFNPNGSAGIGTSIRCGLSATLAADPAASAVILMLCDQPHLDSKILRELIAAFSASQKPMAACEYSNTVGPPCCFARSMFDSLSKIADSDGAKKLLLANPREVTRIPWPPGAIDIDTPQDWRNYAPESI